MLIMMGKAMPSNRGATGFVPMIFSFIPRDTSFSLVYSMLFSLRMSWPRNSTGSQLPPSRLAIFSV